MEKAFSVQCVFSVISFPFFQREIVHRGESGWLVFGTWSVFVYIPSQDLGTFGVPLDILLRSMLVNLT